MTVVDIAPRTVMSACFDSAGIAELEMVYDVARAVGIADQPVRLAIRRMEARGLLRQEGRGRRGRLVRTEAGGTRERVDLGRLQFVAAQDAGVQTWDGRWRLFTFSVPESSRAERDSLRAGLVRLGAASLANGVYVSPFDLRDDLTDEVAAATISRYLITAVVERLDGPGLGDPKQIAETLWPAADIEASYSGLAEALGEAERLGAAAHVATRLACALTLASAFTHAVERDPFVPPELRSPDWAPPRLRSGFRVAWERIQRDVPDVRLFRAYDRPAAAAADPDSSTDVRVME